MFIVCYKINNIINTPPTPPMPVDNETYMYEIPTTEPNVYFIPITKTEFEENRINMYDTSWWVSGDANVDGIVDMLDIIAMGHYLTENGTLTLAGICNGDLNESGDIDANDVVTLLNYIQTI